MFLNMISDLKLSKIWCLFATGFGLGTISWLPVGTAASLLAIPIWWILNYLFSFQFYFLFLIIGTGVGIYFCDHTSKILGVHDPKSIVWDEFVGMWMTLIIVPIHSWLWTIIAFLLFRIFDIVKPWPISWCDREIKGGFGIIIDDILASIISVCIILLLMNLYH
ncbi:phosphatidylglycerophosphatase A [Candidatus Blochmanniella pennsylvanica str. BPEN]|uniref:Phosphatidylglycerophosphatase A n=1 Tax=Blochmanniella pennsylvanica (strain BPEN) TaxID=291272 RepID=Q493G8_BLOPB|nr:phosphatidylglycerophosphatase A [Candidatus Blochmannia pennsylvanicus]AAZ40874.1 phosphatidylglycerophosphatase A [Candidatus Blochmannia pennsylvanicus str. BPEN]UOY04637.1 phosphatidylglycerophosphatase A [Candidatus Blochmannia pennsylvanicus]